MSVPRPRSAVISLRRSGGRPQPEAHAATTPRQRPRTARTVSCSESGLAGRHGQENGLVGHPGRARSAIAAGIPTPVDAYGPSRAYVEVREGGYGVVFGRDGGRRNEPAGPVFPRPRAAIALADLLNDRLLTP